MSFLGKKEQQNLALLDEEFLAMLAEQKERDMYAKIISLDINENSLDEIQGKITDGSLNLDGSSAVRRTCNLTMIAENISINDYYWGLKTKFRLEIGLKNKLTEDYSADRGKYPDIVWFPMGTFILTSFNTSLATNNTTISLSGKDKMCMLNGDLGGQLFASIDFGTEETITTTFKHALIEPSNSDALMSKQYYIIDDTGHIGDSVSKQSHEYAFERSSSGSWFFLNDKYIYGLDENSNKLYIGTYYMRYKKILHPEEMFNPITAGSNILYERDKFYYKKRQNDTHFLLNKTTSFKGNLDYELKDLFELVTEYSIKKIPLEKIIREAVHAYAKEPYHNIIINDLDKYGLEQLSYKGDVPLLVFKNKSTGHFTQVALMNNFIIKKGSYDCKFEKQADNTYQLIPRTSNGTAQDALSFVFDSSLSEGQDIYLNQSNHLWYYDVPPNANDKYKYTVSLINFGDDVGYRITDLVYTGDLISSIGDTLTSILDKIKNMLGDFEYFYDTEGHFVFQRKRSYVNTAWSQFVQTDDERYVTFSNDKRKFSFNFEGNRLLTAVQNAPVLTNLRNDYSVWGKRKSLSGAEIPIHARYAIDKKPIFYRAFDGVIYTTDERYAKKENILAPTYSEITQQVINSLKNFTLEYPVGASGDPNKDIEIFGVTNLTEAIPTHITDENGNPAWSPGWWDIRDWSRYYELLTGEAPRGTMKWYSHGKFDTSEIRPEDIATENLGSVSYSKINYLKTHNYNVQENDPRRVWLLEISYTTNGSVASVSTGHGGGTPSAVGGRRQLCNYYKHEIDPITGNLIDADLNSKEIVNKQKYFNAPYRGCSDYHTYAYFKRVIDNSANKKRILFYNPDFPTQNLNELIQDKIEKEYIEQSNAGLRIVDWREIIYRMALDYFAGQGCSEEKPLYIRDYESEEERWYKITSPDYFLSEVAKHNPDYYPTGYTGYEQYYTDMQGFWRELYNPDYMFQIQYQSGQYEVIPERNSETGYYIKNTSWRDEEVVDCAIDYYIGAELNPFGYTALLEFFNNHNNLKQKYQSYLISSNSIDPDIIRRSGWNKLVFENPEQLNFWIDFLDEGEELSQFQVSQVGDRTKVISEDKISAIIFKEIPDLILYDTRPNPEDESQVPTRDQLEEETGYTWIYLPKGFSQFLSLSYRNLSAKNKLDELLYQYAYCIENITLTTIPVYQLQPNTRIYVCDTKTGIEGEYIVSKLSYSFKYNGTMSITAVKAPERLY